MYRQHSHQPPIPTVVEAEINMNDGGYDDRSLGLTRGPSQYQSFREEQHRGAIPRQLQHPEFSIAPSQADPYYQGGPSQVDPYYREAQVDPHYGGGYQGDPYDERAPSQGNLYHNQGPPQADLYQARAPSRSDLHNRGRQLSTPSLVKAKSAYLIDEQKMDLLEMGFPRGLALELGKNRALFPARFWILDNSGSMLHNDGHTIRGTASVPCTRWNELQETVLYHAELAAVLQATSHFRMLNDPGVRVGPQEFSIAAEGKTAREEIQQVRTYMQNTKPFGATPLTDHLYDIADRIAEMEPMMRERGFSAVLIIATDGMPTSPEGETSDAINNEFINALSRLQTLPVWVVVRLCTDEQAVVDFYNALDNVLELPLEVLDDHINEAKEIHQFNPWLNYALPLHRCREIGYQHRIFDLLDERPLNKDEVKEFCCVLLGEDHFINFTDVHANWNDFIKALTNALKQEKPHYNPLTSKVGPWIDVAQLKKSFGGGILGKVFKRGSVRR